MKTTITLTKNEGMRLFLTLVSIANFFDPQNTGEYLPDDVKDSLKILAPKVLSKPMLTRFKKTMKKATVKHA